MSHEVTLTPHEAVTYALLQGSLSVAVPVCIAQFQTQSWASIQDRLEAITQMVAEHGDDILYRSKKPGGSAAAFTALAEGVAAAAFVPGGITIFGLHFEARHPDHAADAAAAPHSPAH